MEARTKSKTGAPIRNLRPEQWYRLALPDYNRRSGTFDRTHDCSGAALRWRESHDERRCFEPDPAPDPLPTRRLTDDDLIMSRVDADKRLIWVVTRRFDNGEGEGPVVLAEFTDRGVAVRATGTLRAMVKRSRLRIQRTGTFRMLVAEGERCTDDEDPRTCQRFARILLLRNRRFQNIELVREDGRCIGPTNFPMTRDDTIELPSGWNRRFQLASSVQFENGGFTVHEQVTVHDSDPRHPAVPPRLYRRSSSERTVRVSRGRMIASHTSLWHRMRVLRAAVRVPLRYDAGPDADLYGPDAGFQ